MSFFFGDGFDLYAQPSDAANGYWDATSISLNSSGLVTGRFSNSRAWQTNFSSALIKTSGQNDAVHHFVFALMSPNITGSALGFYIELFDGATAQCSVVFRSDGWVLLTSGSPTGAVLDSWANAFPASGVWYAFEIEVVINNTTGSWTIRRNGNPVNDHAASGLNTRPTSTNNYANAIRLGSQNSLSYPHIIDDFLWRSGDASGVLPSGVPWVGDIRCYTRRPTSDSSVQFSRTSAPASSVLWSPVGVPNNLAAGTAQYLQFVSPYSGLLTGITFPNSNGGTGHIKTAVFSSVSGLVGTVLATSNELTNPVTNGLTFSFSSPAYLVAGQTYWIAYINDSGSVALAVVNAPAGCLAMYTLPQTYATWPVSSPGGTPVNNQNVPGLTLAFTPQSNSDAVSELYTDNLSSYVYSSTNGQADFYAIWSIGVTPLTTIGVTTRGYFEKSDAGTRNATVQLKSGSTTVQGPNTALNTVWGWIYRNDLVDPATSAPWTATAVNGVQIGPVVTA